MLEIDSKHIDPVIAEMHRAQDEAQRGPVLKSTPLSRPTAAYVSINHGCPFERLALYGDCGPSMVLVPTFGFGPSR